MDLDVEALTKAVGFCRNYRKTRGKMEFRTTIVMLHLNIGGKVL